jgi:hypothetical protein
MGPAAEPGYVAVAICALGGALRRLGHAVDIGAGIEAAMTEIAKAPKDQAPRITATGA